MASLAGEVIPLILAEVKRWGIAEYTRNWELGRYYEGGAGKQWESRKHSYDHPILIDTQKSIKSLNALIRTGEVLFTVGNSSANYIKYHQTGYTIGNTYVPARPVLYDLPTMDKVIKQKADLALGKVTRIIAQRHGKAK